jgi:hypothetical protein
MNRDTIFFPLCSLLTIGIMTYTFQWLGGRHTISSDIALKKAEQSLVAYCAKAGLHPYEMQLMDESAPDSQHPHWHFQFQSDRDKRVLVEVSQGGSTRILANVPN